jgi:UDP-N-acetyl-D-glucosamine dehydrogenase
MKKKLKTIAVQGFGFVGAVNSVNVAVSNHLKDYQVLCFEKKNERTIRIFDKASKGEFPYNTNDINLVNKFKKLVRAKKIRFTFNKNDYEKASIVLVTINYDLKKIKLNKRAFLDSFKEIINNVKKNTLIIIESTVPPGTCKFLLEPLLNKIKKEKKLNLYLSHAFERVTPGKNYLNSCKNAFRVYSGINKKSKLLCKDFLKKITNYKKFELTELENTTSSETCKIIENSYRAVNIAFIDEWMKFSKELNINLYSVIDAIKKRPTHNNIMLPGLGVGGYCLTKDPFFGNLTSKIYLKDKKLKFPLSNISLRINNKMTENSLQLILNNYSRSIKNKKILLIGMTYKNDVGDIRNSPSVELAKKLIKSKAKIYYYDPLVNEEIKNFTKVNLVDNSYDIILFCVKHQNFKKFSFIKFDKMKKTVFFDLNDVLENKLYEKTKKKCKIYKLAFPC